LPNDIIDLPGIPDVQPNREGFSAFLLQVFLYLSSQLQVQIGNSNHASLLSQSARDACSDAAPGARNQSNLIGQKQVHRPFLGG
jgi:hypothetical protein